ncbi:MAG: hypothetical protein M1836_007413 [Candelina mexicana]|nr:MAG: hypothetical protein M1836_007413 [Candelina mexicana]
MRNRFKLLLVVSIACCALLGIIKLGGWIPNRNQSLPVPWSIHAESLDEVDRGPDWSFEYKRDWRNYGLSIEQCDAAFPRLFKEIHRAAAFRQHSHITQEELDGSWRGDAFVRAMVYDGQLYIIEAKGVDEGYYRSRSLALMHSIHRAIVATSHLHVIPNIEFTFVVDDMADPGHTDNTTWALSRRPDWQNLWLMPDFGFWSWPEVKVGSYVEVQQKILDREEEGPFEDKIWQLVWRGSVSANPKLRGDLLDATKDKEWSDVQPLNWRNEEDLANNLLSIADHCRYMFIAHTEGRSYSGRLKYIQGCHSVIVAPKLTWIQHHHHLLISAGPQQNFLEVKSDFSDLESQMQYHLSHLDVTKRIADNSVKTFRERYLTPAAEACYWRELFRKWADVSFEPEFYREVEAFDKIAGEMLKQRQWRGVPFESYIITGAVEWEIS